MRVSRWLISPKTHAPLVGAFQDALIGLAELTKDGIKFDKWHAMEMLADINTLGTNFKFDKKTYTNRELVSRLLPQINLLNKSPAMYKKGYAAALKYNPADINVNIVRGELKSGILDKATCGQDKAGSIFHIIANTFGNDKALETVYNFQMIVHKFLLYHGFTVGINDINISDKAMKEVKRRTAAMILEARKITQRLNNGKLIPPIGMPLTDFYESEQMTALREGDDYIEPILSDVDLDANQILRLILTGSKGKDKNFINLNGSLGTQTINGSRFGAQFGWGRTSPYFTRYDTEPESRGYVSTSYREGVLPEVYPFMAAEARHGAISNALKTSVTGYQNRISIKNLETIISDNTYKATKGMNLIQPLYAECGLDLGKLEKVKFPTVLISSAEFLKYKTEIGLVDKKYQNPAVKKLLEEEFKQLTEDREEYRRIHFKLEDHFPRVYQLSNEKLAPVNVFRVLEDTIYNHTDLTEKLKPSERILDPAYAVKIVKELCDNLGYSFTNKFQRDAKRKIPLHIEASTKMLRILIRSYLNVKTMLEKGVNNHLLDIMVLKITYLYKKALIDAGTPVGILAAQCISEPMTQFVLDSKHRVGGAGGTQTNAIVRLQEVLGAKDTETMKNPHMLVMLRADLEHDKLKAQEVANYIEQMTFDRFVSKMSIFFEEYGKPVHSKYTHEATIIKQLEKHNYGQKLPSDLAKWCLRFSIDKEQLILKSMRLETVILAIRKAFPQLYIIYTPENADDVFIRCYFRNGQFKSTQDFYGDIVLYTAQEVKKVIVRGVKNIISTEVINIVKHVVGADGSIEQKTVFGINCVGTNTSAVLALDEVDPYRTQSDSIEEVEQVYGIVAARNKIINELVTINEDLNRFHCTVFADEMCYSGQVTSIQRTGLQKREQANITLQISFQNQIQVITNAAINGFVDRINGVSGPLIVGTNPSVGTCYNTLIVNEDFLKENMKKLSSIEEEL